MTTYAPVAFSDSSVGQTVPIPWPYDKEEDVEVLDAGGEAVSRSFWMFSSPGLVELLEGFPLGISGEVHRLTLIETDEDLIGGSAFDYELVNGQIDQLTFAVEETRETSRSAREIANTALNDPTAVDARDAAVLAAGNASDSATAAALSEEQAASHVGLAGTRAGEAASSADAAALSAQQAQELAGFDPDTKLDVGATAANSLQLSGKGVASFGQLDQVQTWTAHQTFAGRINIDDPSNNPRFYMRVNGLSKFLMQMSGSNTIIQNTGGHYLFATLGASDSRITVREGGVDHEVYHPGNAPEVTPTAIETGTDTTPGPVSAETLATLNNNSGFQVIGGVEFTTAGSIVVFDNLGADNKEILVEFDNLASSGSSFYALEVSEDNGASWLTSGYRVHVEHGADYVVGVSYIPLMPTSASLIRSGSVKFKNVNDLSFPTHVEGQTNYGTNFGRVNNIQGAVPTISGPINAVRLRCVSSNFTSGEARISTRK